MLLRNTPVFALAFFTLACLPLPMIGHGEAIAKEVRDASDQDQQEGDRHDVVQKLDEGAHVDGHIAFLHAELRITAEQEALWAPVADAMKEDVASWQSTENDVYSKSGNSETAVRYLENRERFARLRAQGELRFLNAFKPLYDDLSSAQKKSADQILIPHDSP